VPLFNSPTLRFVVLSGFGWILDFVVFWIGITKIGLVPGIANFVSATVAAMLVYCSSQWFVFDNRRIAFTATVGYLLYTEVNIVVWALVIHYISIEITKMVEIDIKSAALVTKIVITPLSLGCNYLVSRAISSKEEK
jgi:putative flippase GtrA